MAQANSRISSLEKKIAELERSRLDERQTSKRLQNQLTMIFGFLEDLANSNPSLTLPSLSSVHEATTYRCRCCPAPLPSMAEEPIRPSWTDQLRRRDNVVPSILESPRQSQVQSQSFEKPWNPKFERLKSIGKENFQKRSLERARLGKLSLSTFHEMPSTIFESSKLLASINQGNQDVGTHESTRLGETTGEIFLNSFDKSLHEMAKTGDPTLEGILAALEREAFSHLKAWRLRSHELADGKNRSALIRTILSAQNIHKFVKIGVTLTVSPKSSVWPSIIDEVFRDAAPENRKRLVSCLANSCRKSGPFGHFTKCIVKVHKEYCKQCNIVTEKLQRS